MNEPDYYNRNFVRNIILDYAVQCHKDSPRYKDGKKPFLQDNPKILEQIYNTRIAPKVNERKDPEDMGIFIEELLQDGVLEKVNHKYNRLIGGKPVEEMVYKITDKGLEYHKYGGYENQNLVLDSLNPTALPKKNAGIHNPNTCNKNINKLLRLGSKIMRLKTNDSIWILILISLISGLILFYITNIHPKSN